MISACLKKAPVFFSIGSKDWKDIEGIAATQLQRKGSSVKNDNFLDASEACFVTLEKFDQLGRQVL